VVGFYLLASFSLNAANIAYASVDANRIIQNIEGDVASILGVDSNESLIGSAVIDVLENFRIEDPVSGAIFTPQQIAPLIDTSLSSDAAHRTSNGFCHGYYRRRK